MAIRRAACLAVIMGYHGRKTRLAEAEEHDSANEVLVLPELTAVDLDGQRLKIVTTTSIIGDVVSQVGGEEIELTTLRGAFCSQ